MNDNKNGKKSNNEKKPITDRLVKLPNIIKDNVTFNNINFIYKNIPKPNSGNPNNVKNNLQKNFKNKYYDNKDRKRDINTANPLLIVPTKNLTNSPNFNFQYRKRENKSSPKNYANFFEMYINNRNFNNIDNNNNIINKSNNNIEQTFKNKKSFATKIKDVYKTKNPKLAQKLDILININFNNIINNQFNKSPHNISPKNLNLHLIDSPSPNLKKNFLKLYSFNKPENTNLSNKKENKGNNIINNNINNNQNNNQNNNNKTNNTNQNNNQNNKNNQNNNNKNNNQNNNNNTKNINQNNIKNNNQNNNNNNNINLNKNLNFQNNINNNNNNKQNLF